MTPPFDVQGYLPPGIHPATLDEIAAFERMTQQMFATDRLGIAKGMIEVQL